MANLFRRVVLTADIPQHGLRIGDVGVVVETYEGRGDIPPAFEVEFFSATGDTVAVVTVPATNLRDATAQEVLSAREMTGA
jgi:hypothetical protein